MKTGISSYKNFIDPRGSYLRENVQASDKNFIEKDEQFRAFEECRKQDIVKFSLGSSGSLAISDREYFFSEAYQGIVFEGDLKITSKFKGKSLLELPFRMAVVTGIFDCSGLEIEDLRGCPQNVQTIDASSCSLKSLRGCPKMVGNLNVEDNIISSLAEGPDFVFGKFILRDNILRDLDNGPLLIDGEIGLLGNPKIQKQGIGVLFDKMHKDIRSNYGSGSWKNIEGEVNKDIANKNYVVRILAKNPEYEKFLGRFSEETQEWEFLKNVKDFGII